MSAHLMQRGLLRLRPGLLLRAAANAANAAGRTGPKWSHVRTMASAKGNPQEDYWPIKVQIGKREVVGFGSNGEEVYLDDVHHPFPAIRFKEDTGEIAKLREKEKGDWKKLTAEEKKQLYRASFCQTLSEVEAHTGEWKGILGISFIFTALGVWGYILLKMFVYPPMPDTITDDEKVKVNIQRMIDMRVNPVEGLTSNYDYEKNDWKWNK